MLIFQPNFSAKDHDCMKIYPFGMFETMFILCHENNFPVTAILLLLLLCTRTYVCIVRFSYHCSNCNLHVSCSTEGHAVVLSKQGY